MNKRFEPALTEESIYSFWEKSGLLKAPEKGEPYTILMPPPNANGSLHAGHGMYAIDDIMLRYKRMQGFAGEWIPGMDHAGFETQTTFEKHLKKSGKSRFDFNRNELYEKIFEFVRENSGLIYTQFKRLGFLADWNKSVFTLDPHVIEYVYETFTQMVKDGYVYRDDYIVNYCTHDGTSLADLEVKYVERTDPLYYIKYGPFVLATVRPETKFGDTALAVHPSDARYKEWVGREVECEGLLGAFKLKVIADDFVDPEFGTGVVKITPGHDPNDFAAGRRHNLEVKQIIDLTGRLTAIAGPYAGMKVAQAREVVVADLQKMGLIKKIDENYVHSVSTCYRCGRDIEPLTVPNWFLRVAKLKKTVKDVVEKDEVKFHPAKFKARMLQWLDVMHDWPISRQIVWGIRIPVWYKVSKDTKGVHVSWLDKDKKFQTGLVAEFLSNGTPLDAIEKGLQKVIAQPDVEYVVSDHKPGPGYLPETDTFDTWFSSGQWPLVTLQHGEQFPTDFMGTQSEILKFWVSRMILFSIYRKKTIPFKDVYLWSLVVDGKGKKMSKSKGNVINPIDYIDKYGADAFRASLLFGIGEGGTVVLSEDKVRAMRNFANKLWNIGRLMKMYEPNTLHVPPLRQPSAKASDVAQKGFEGQARSTLHDKDKKTLHELSKEIIILKNKYIKDMDTFKFSRAFDNLYEFVWHRFADYYLEELKDAIRAANSVVLSELMGAYDQCLLLLHPFVPFVTEALWQEIHATKRSILYESINRD